LEKQRPAHFAESGSKAVAEAITRREQQLATLEQQLDRMQRPVLSSGLGSRIEALARKKIAALEEPMHRNQSAGRQLLSKTLRGRIKFERQRRGKVWGWKWSVDAHLWGLLEGDLPLGSAGVASPTG